MKLESTMHGHVPRASSVHCAPWCATTGPRGRRAATLAAITRATISLAGASRCRTSTAMLRRRSLGALLDCAALISLSLASLRSVQPWCKVAAAVVSVVPVCVCPARHGVIA